VLGSRDVNGEDFANEMSQGVMNGADIPERQTRLVVGVRSEKRKSWERRVVKQMTKA